MIVYARCVVCGWLRDSKPNTTHALWPYRVLEIANDSLSRAWSVFCKYMQTKTSDCLINEGNCNHCMYANVGQTPPVKTPPVFTILVYTCLGIGQTPPGQTPGKKRLFGQTPVNTSPFFSLKNA